MKYCPHCGKEVADNSKFCPGCGGAISSGSGQQGGWGGGGHYGGGTASGNPAKRAVKSPLFLAAVIANSINIVLSLIGIFTYSTSGLLGNLMRYIPGYSDGDLGRLALYYGSGYLNTFDGIIKGVSFLILVPSVIFCIGLWLIWNTATDETRVSTTGFTMVRVILIIDIVLYALLFLIMILLGIILMFEDDAGAGLVMIIIMLVIGALFMFFYIQAINAVDTIKNDMITGGPTHKLSLYIAVIGFIMGVFSVIGLFGQHGFVNVLSSLAGIVWIFCASIWIMQYKSFQ